MTIKRLEEVHESRLTWPDHRPRAAHRIGSVFKTEVAKATQEIEWEMARWRVRQFIISRNNQRIFAGDPGAALWWNAPPKKQGDLPQLRVLACDKYQTLAANLHAIYLTLDAMRALERWGAYTMEQAAQGATLSLPPPANSTPPEPPWWETLGVPRDWPLDAIEFAWKVKAERAHPDREGGSQEEMARLNNAITAARKELAAK